MCITTYPHPRHVQELVVFWRLGFAGFCRGLGLANLPDPRHNRAPDMEALDTLCGASSYVEPYNLNVGFLFRGPAYPPSRPPHRAAGPLK
jgi:hypothetical protein